MIVSAGTSLTKVCQRLAGTASLLLGLALLSGCDPDPYPEDLKYPLRTDLLILRYEADVLEPEPLGQLEQHISSLRDRPDADTVDPAALTAEGRDRLRAALDQTFGTPAHPRVRTTDPEMVAVLGLEEETLARGSILYRRHCVHCHGVAGDGRGPTAPWIIPHPRDYRRGHFKFTSVIGGITPRREDLIRTLYEGIETTSMPSFKHLPRQQLEDLVSYVIHLSVRGEVEFEMIKDLVRETVQPADVAEEVEEIVDITLDRWTQAQQEVAAIQPIEYPYEEQLPQAPEESIRRGHALFHGDGGCTQCHLNYGRQSLFKVDIWGTRSRPADLTAGVYRGGRRPLDLYYRIHSGIGGTGMPGATPEIQNDPQKMWDLLNFVRALPYPAMLPDDVHEQVYGPRRKS